jgi:hypothetical protein
MNVADSLFVDDDRPWNRRGPPRGDGYQVDVVDNDDALGGSRWPTHLFSDKDAARHRSCSRPSLIPSRDRGDHRDRRRSMESTSEAMNGARLSSKTL